MKDGTDQSEGDEDKALWALLGRARKPAVSPYFARRVLRDMARQPRRGIAGWWQRATHWLAMPRVAWSVAAALAVLCATGALRPGQSGSGLSAVRPGEAKMASTGGTQNAEMAGVPDDVSPQDYAVIADLDNQLAQGENDAWVDDQAR